MILLQTFIVTTAGRLGILENGLWLVATKKLG